MDRTLPRSLQAHRLRAIFLISVAGLFLQLMLIRWIGTEVRIFAYLQNTILVVCFLGMGYGCFTAQRDPRLRNLLVALLVLAVLLAVPASRAELQEISRRLSVLDDLIIWEKGMAGDQWSRLAQLVIGLAESAAIMFLTLETAIPIGRILGRLMNEHPNTVAAYSWNVAGSLFGIWLFVLLSVFYQPPVTWMLVGVLCLLPFLGRPRWPAPLDVALAVAVVAMSWYAGRDSTATATYWSPYQKLVVRPGDPGEDPPRVINVTVNNAAYQAMIDLRPGRIPYNSPAHPIAMYGYSQYDLPARLHPNPKSMLIVGAGSGNDAAGALRQNVPQVTAVEIDPAIIEIGRRYHPERPYESSHVRVVTDDARSYFATSRERFDVIAFGLLDSHTTTAMTNARLDHYVYTIESLRQARRLLEPGGMMTLTFEAQKPYIADRIGRALWDIFGVEPLVFRVPFTGYGWGGTMFVAGDLDAAQRQIRRDGELDALIRSWQQHLPVPLEYRSGVITDDWPYIYLEFRRIPTLYYLLGALLALMLGRCFRIFRVRELAAGSGANLHFFFLGAAFLLLEVQNISKASVVLGNTWIVNAVIISGVLTMILLANAIAVRFPRLPLGPVYAALLGSCVALYLVDISRFAFLPYVAKALIVGGLTTLPMLFSGIVFIRSFSSVPHKDAALGANMIGALVGGLLQSVTFVTGIKALLLLVAGLYFLALLTRPAAAGRPLGFASAAPPAA